MVADDAVHTGQHTYREAVDVVMVFRQSLDDEYNNLICSFVHVGSVAPCVIAGNAEINNAIKKLFLKLIIPFR